MDESWHSDVETALRVRNSSEVDWSERADLVIVGLGAAGVSCALQALELGQNVIAVDRFGGGGATAASGGVLYAGGGTTPQKTAGVTDTPDAMHRYLQTEVGDIVSDATLRDFCERSAETVDWMSGHGVDFRSDYYPGKTSYPAPEYFLYHSDNSLLPRARKVAPPAPRGHRGFVPVRQGRKAVNLGGSLFDPLCAAATAKGLRVFSYTEARQLVIDEGSAVLGIKVLRFPDRTLEKKYIALRAKAQRIMTIYPPILPCYSLFLKRGMAILAQATALEARRKAQFIRADKAVLLSAGGFVFNRAMMKEYAPKYRRTFPLGTDGDNGAGIRLGQTAGGAVGNMSRVSAWRFINPPLSFARGLIVNAQGERFINEMVYGATLGVEMAENHYGKAWLILDKALIQNAKRDVAGKKALAFQKALARLNIHFGATKANTVEALAGRIGIDPDTLRASVDAYNRGASADAVDELGKAAADIATLGAPPFYAINIGLDSKLFPCPALTLGGLRVDETTGQVLDEIGAGVPGLYAAGRNAIGVASWNYISGLSIADGIYSGRRTARAVARL